MKEFVSSIQLQANHSESDRMECSRLEEISKQAQHCQRQPQTKELKLDAISTNGRSRRAKFYRSISSVDREWLIKRDGVLLLDDDAKACVLN
jgi:hypothetical protein